MKALLRVEGREGKGRERRAVNLERETLLAAASRYTSAGWIAA